MRSTVQQDTVRLVAIGDLHGKSTWEKIVAREPLSTKEIFLGDYFDSWHESAGEQIENFKRILVYKEENPARVVLLMGNHDYHYLSQVKERRYSGYQAAHAATFEDLLDYALTYGLIQACYEHGGFLFSHAGVTKTWLTDNGCNLSTDNIPIFVNTLFRSAPERFKYDDRDSSGFGEHKSQGPFWVRPNSLQLDAVEGYRQVVGHSKVKSIVPLKGAPIFIDVLDTVAQYLVVENGKPVVMTL